VESDAPIGHYGNFSRIQICNEKVYNSLIRWGCVPRKTKVLTSIPVDDKILVPPFIRGYFDGDGCVGLYDYSSTKKGKTYTYTYPQTSITGTKLLMEDFINQSEASLNGPYRDGSMFQIGAKGKKAKKFLRYIYGNATIYLDRKYETYLLVEEEK